MLVVLARSFWRAPLRFGPGIKSAVAIRFINLEIERWPSSEILIAKVKIMVIFSGAPVNQSRADCMFWDIFMIRRKL